MAQIVAEVALAFNHLWEDLGLDSRAELGRLMSDCFPLLVVQNVHHMRWKKFFTASAACSRRGRLSADRRAATSAWSAASASNRHRYKQAAAPCG
jgi:hypothetical protein